MDYFKLYEELYQNGYRNKHKIAGRKFFKQCNRALEYKSILDVGCGWGELVSYTSKSLNKIATGVDVSQTAVSKACSDGLNCHVGSVCKLPFSADVFDLATCFDVLEHLVKEDIPTALRELCQVSKKYIALQVATKGSRNHWAMIAEVRNLHLTVWTADTWKRTLLECLRETANIAYYFEHRGHACFLLEKK